MNNKNELKIKLKELEANLENSSVQEELKTKKFNLDDLKHAIRFYLENIEQINDEDLKSISTKVNELVSHSNQSSFSVYSHRFINTARYLINNPPEVEPDMNDNLDIKDNIKISEEEFSKRYDKLIEALNFEGEESNLVLESLTDHIPFQVFNKENHLYIVPQKKFASPMWFSKESLIDAIYKTERKLNQYEATIIEKLNNNSIFEFLVKVVQTDLLEAMKSKLSNNENELLKLSSKLEEIEKHNQELSTIKQKLSETLKQSTTAKQAYEDAKNAAVNDAKLKKSVEYWETKQKNHRNKSIGFGFIAILLIGLFVKTLFWASDFHENQINKDIKNLRVGIETKNTQDSNRSQEKSLDATKQIQSEIEKVMLQIKEKTKSCDFDYSQLTWYILMIFASSSAFWIIRITVKIALSNLHLSEDAHERVVMIQTYLSFVKEGQVDEKDKNLILSSLFRPSNIGIIQDESSVTVADIITAIKK